jgi:hypothetical protein
MSIDLILGWFLGLVSSIISGIVLFWLQARRDRQNEVFKQRREDIRTARNWAKEDKKISLRGFDLTGANLSGKDFSGADLEEADFEDARMWSTNFSESNLRHANFRNAMMVGVNFKNAQLLLADFTGAVVREANFTGAKMRRTKFRQVKEVEKCIWESVGIDETTELSFELLQEIQKVLPSKEET